MVLVTGGCGFIGYKLVETLVNLGYEVDVIDNLYIGHEAKDVKQMFAELNKMENQTMLKNSCCYLVVWVNNDYVNRQKSEV